MKGKSGSDLIPCTAYVIHATRLALETLEAHPYYRNGLAYLAHTCWCRSSIQHTMVCFCNHVRMRQSLVPQLFRLLLVWATLSTTAVSAHQSPLNSPINIRNATVDDAEAITAIIQAAFHDAPDNKYVYQFMDEHPRHMFKCILDGVGNKLHDPRIMAHVALLPNSSAPHDLVPAAVALWVLPSVSHQSLRMNGPPYLSLSTLAPPPACLPTLNITRAIDFDHQFTTAWHRYLNDVYPTKQQFYLATLATHPEFQRRGAGGALVTSGLAFAEGAYGKKNVTATLIATEVGEPLYLHLAWESIKNFTVESLDVIKGYREGWRFDVMKYDI